MKKTPNAVTSVGTMIDHVVPVQPSFDITMNRGTMPSCVGTAMVATTPASSADRPRNRSLAKAYPASVPKTTVEVAQTDDTSTLLPRAFQNGTVSMTRLALSRK